MKTGYGYGKVILFGEHFVVHGLPAIVAALPYKTLATVERIAGKLNVLVDQRPKVPTFKPTKQEKYLTMLNNIHKFMGISSAVRITLGGDLIVTSGGIGASAAAAVAIARALNAEFNLGWDDDRLNQAAFAGEQAVHGTPSGIDNTAAMFGGVFVYKKNPETLHVERTPIELPESLDLVLIDSGHASDTQRVIFGINDFKQRHPDRFEKFCKTYEHIFEQAHEALQLGDLIALGVLMINNHDLLKQMGISLPLIDELVMLAKGADALGAKMTGTGCGGLVVALTLGNEGQDWMVSAMKVNGYTTIKVSILNESLLQEELTPVAATQR